VSGPAFLDTNILVYAALQSDRRSDAARGLLASGGMISVQVLNEFTNVAHRKLRRPWLEIARAVEAICFLCPPPLPLTLSTHHAARRIAEGTGFAFYDALIVASALEAKCGILYSEDLQDGQVIEGRLTVRNPFGGG
jgi:predicted nucleic acid-binding protein